MTTHQDLADRALALVDAIAHETQDMTLPATLRNRLAAAAFGTVLEHQHAIAILVQERRLPSAFALLRSLWESYIRASWLVHCVPDDKLEKYTSGKFPEARDVIKALMALPDFEFKVLADFKDSHWSSMCDYAHTGALQLQRWQGAEFIEPKHTVEETAEVLYLAGLYGLFAAAGQAGLADDLAKGRRMLALAEALAP